MKKKIIAAVIVAALAAACVIAFLSLRNADPGAQYEKHDLELYGELNIISDAEKIDSSEYSLSSLKEAYRLGVRTVTLNLCFNKKGEPVICDNFKNITADSLKLSDVITFLEDEQYSDLRCNLRMRQTGDFKKVNELIANNGIYNRVIISGLDKERYSLLTGKDTQAQVYYDYKPQKDARKAVEEIKELITENEISGVFIDVGDLSKELYEQLSLQGIACVASGADSRESIYEALSCGAYLIETGEPELLNSIYASWYEKTYKRLESGLYNKEESQ